MATGKQPSTPNKRPTAKAKKTYSGKSAKWRAASHIQEPSLELNSELVKKANVILYETKPGRNAKITSVVLKTDGTTVSKENSRPSPRVRKFAFAKNKDSLSDSEVIQADVKLHATQLVDALKHKNTAFVNIVVDRIIGIVTGSTRGRVVHLCPIEATYSHVLSPEQISEVIDKLEYELWSGLMDILFEHKEQIVDFINVDPLNKVLKTTFFSDKRDTKWLLSLPSRFVPGKILRDLPGYFRLEKQGANKKTTSLVFNPVPFRAETLDLKRSGSNNNTEVKDDVRPDEPNAPETGNVEAVQSTEPHTPTLVREPMFLSQQELAELLSANGIDAAKAPDLFKGMKDLTVSTALATAKPAPKTRAKRPPKYTIQDLLKIAATPGAEHKKARSNARTRLLALNVDPSLIPRLTAPQVAKKKASKDKEL